MPWYMAVFFCPLLVKKVISRRLSSDCGLVEFWACGCYAKRVWWLLFPPVLRFFVYLYMMYQCIDM